MGQVFVRVLRCPPVRNIPPSSSARCCYQKDKRAKPGSSSKISALSEIGEHLIESKIFSRSLERVKAIAGCEGRAVWSASGQDLLVSSCGTWFQRKFFLGGGGGWLLKVLESLIRSVFYKNETWFRSAGRCFSTAERMNRSLNGMKVVAATATLAVRFRRTSVQPVLIQGPAEKPDDF